MARNVPFGIASDGRLRSPLMFAPARMPFEAREETEMPGLVYMIYVKLKKLSTTAYLLQPER